MTWFAVHSGGILACVEADRAIDAAIFATRVHLQRVESARIDPTGFQVADQFGNLFHLPAKRVDQNGGFSGSLL